MCFKKIDFEYSESAFEKRMSSQLTIAFKSLEPTDQPETSYEAYNALETQAGALTVMFHS